MQTTTTPQTEYPMRSFTIPAFTVTTSLAASLAAAPLRAAHATGAIAPEASYELTGIDATESAIAEAFASALQIVESVGADLLPGDGFSDAQAAALGRAIALRKSSLPITEADLGSDL